MLLKPVAYALKCTQEEDLAEVSSTFNYYGGWADKIHGEVINTDSTKFAYTLREPIGVCGQIIPWNYPVRVFLRYDLSAHRLQVQKVFAAP